MYRMTSYMFLTDRDIAGSCFCSAGRNCTFLCHLVFQYLFMQIKRFSKRNRSYIYLSFHTLILSLKVNVTVLCVNITESNIAQSTCICSSTTPSGYMHQFVPTTTALTLLKQAQRLQADGKEKDTGLFSIHRSQ